LVRRPIVGPFDINGTTWTPIRLFHGEMPILGFRLGNIAYCTDVNRIPPESYDLLQGLDVLVLDALTRNTHATHFSLDQAVAEAAKIKAKQTFFTHVAHGLAHAATNATLPKGVALAHDGLRVRAN
jgi:phosphoribosyl 1,2-cyclic phosphate phosphodiesterase